MVWRGCRNIRLDAWHRIVPNCQSAILRGNVSTCQWAVVVGCWNVDLVVAWTDCGQPSIDDAAGSNAGYHVHRHSLYDQLRAFGNPRENEMADKPDSIGSISDSGLGRRDMAKSHHSTSLGTNQTTPKYNTG